MGRSRVRVVIQHHPSRAARVAELVQALPGLDVRVVEDPDPDAEPSPWRCYRACLRAAPRHGHVLILQDDAVVCAGFGELLAAAVAERPGQLLSLYTGHYPQQTAVLAVQALERGERWVQSLPANYCAAVATVWPAAQRRAFLAWAEQRADQWRGPMADDHVIARWLTATGEPYWHLVPNLVEHPDDCESLMGTQRGSHLRRSCVPPAVLWSA